MFAERGGRVGWRCSHSDCDDNLLDTRICPKFQKTPDMTVSALEPAAEHEEGERVDVVPVRDVVELRVCIRVPKHLCTP